jgi:DNA recombination protein RmuC
MGSEFDGLRAFWALLAFVVGAALSWALASRQARLALDVAVANAIAPIELEKAMLTERVQKIGKLEDEISRLNMSLSAVSVELSDLRTSSAKEKSRLEAELSAERRALQQSSAELDESKTEKNKLDVDLRSLVEEAATLRSRNEASERSLAEQVKLLNEAKQTLADHFKSLAAEILDEKARGFSEQSSANLDQLLSPLKTQITEFKDKVEKLHTEGGKERVELGVHIKSLAELNKTLSADAQNLAHALKGQAKTQGNWGELILERVLEASGLRKGHEYQVQQNQLREDGTRAQPDVVIDLPEERKLIVDAKVSLVAYERYVTATTDADRSLSARQHLDSIRAHIRSLSTKNYQLLYGVQAMDFVVAFVPVEPAFLLAVSEDENLFMDAWQKNVLLVSPSILLFVVRTVAHLWRQEQQSRNAQEIAKRGAELYEKLCGFVADLDKVGTRLTDAKTAYDDAYVKLTSGRGNAIRQAEMLRELGVKPTKQLPQPLVAAALEGDLGSVIAVDPLTGPVADVHELPPK